MQANDLRSRVGFYKRPEIDLAASPPPTDYGNTEGEYPADPEFECAANIKPRLGGEPVLAGRLTGTNLVNITVRKFSRTASVDTSWRIKDARSAEVFNIRSIVDPDEGTSMHGRFLEMLCEKGVAS